MTDVSVSGLPGIFQGRVEHIGPRADSETRTFPVEVLIDNKGSKKLLPGMLLRARQYSGAHLSNECAHGLKPS